MGKSWMAGTAIVPAWIWVLITTWKVIDFAG
jgi:hypothetical protein